VETARAHTLGKGPRSSRWKGLNVLKNDRHISKPRLLDKSRALYRRACERDARLPPLSPVAGKVEVKGAVRVTLPTIGGKAIVTATPIGGWRFELEYAEYLPAAVPVGAKAAAAPAATFEAQTHDAMLDLIVDLERRIFAAFERRMCAFEAKHHLPNNNIIHLNNVAAE
jgi:hypothetical protein